MGGSTNSGHYYSYVKNSNGIWYEMNDTSVRQVRLNRVLKDSAYILFYASMNPSEGDGIEHPTAGVEPNLLPVQFTVPSRKSEKKEQNPVGGREMIYFTKRNKRKEIDYPKNNIIVPVDDIKAKKELESKGINSTFKFSIRENKSNSSPSENESILNSNASLSKDPQWLQLKQNNTGKTIKNSIAKVGNPHRAWAQIVSQVNKNKRKDVFLAGEDAWGAASDEKLIQSRILDWNRESMGPSFISKRRDRFEEELDIGKKKKSKKKRLSSSNQSSNPFSRLSGADRKKGRSYNRKKRRKHAKIKSIKRRK